MGRGAFHQKKRRIATSGARSSDASWSSQHSSTSPRSGWCGALPSPRHPATPPESPEPSLQEIIVVDEAPVVRDDELASLIDPAVERPASAAPATTSRESSESAANGSSPEASGEPPAASPEAPAEPTAPLVFTKPGTDTRIGLDGRNRFLTPDALASVEVGRKGGDSRGASNERAREMVKGSGRARDLALGLGGEGPVLHALGDATTASLAPVKGRAVFVVDTNASGEVVSVIVGDTNGDRPGWLDAARVALEALKGKKLVMRGGPSATRMHIEVVSAWKMPSGTDPGLDVDVLGIPVQKGEGPSSARVSLLDPRTGAIVSAFGDLSDLGAKPRRIVHTRLLDATPL